MIQAVPSRFKDSAVLSQLSRLSRDELENVVFHALCALGASSDGERELAVRGADGNVLGYFVPRDRREMLNTYARFMELEQRRRDPGDLLTAEQAIERIAAGTTG